MTAGPVTAGLGIVTVAVPVRLRPSNPVARNAILVGDPGRALALAQELLVDPKMSNHARGLWGYTSRTAAGLPLTIQATGLGGPSAAAVLADLAALGVERAIRVGTCRSLSSGIGPGEAVAIEGATALDGASLSLEAAGPRHHGARPVVPGGAELARLLAQSTGRSGRVLCRDVDPAREPASALASIRDSLAPDCEIADMQTAALLASGHRLEVEMAAVLITEWSREGNRLEPESLEAAMKRAGGAAAAALAGEPLPLVEA